MARTNFYAETGLDRVAHLRGDPAWFETTLADAESRIVPYWRNLNLVVPGESPEAVVLRSADARSLIDAASSLIFLGMNGDVGYFAADLSSSEAPEKLPDLAGRGSFVELRSVGVLLSRGDGALLAYARALFYWHARHGFCSVCGASTEMREFGHLRVCTNAACGVHHFPRTDPAVIMLVSRSDKCLLGRKPEWTEGMYSTLAGFVEPGESLEEAVAREVMEETGVAVADITYHSSQPWPFPASLMLGFTARAVNEEVVVYKEELEDARWFTRAELASGGAGIAIRPRSDSIARRLIEDWIEKGNDD